MRSARTRFSRTPRYRFALLVACALGSLLACGGSSSESPWPVEPLEKQKGPRDEALPGTEAADLMDSDSAAGGAGGDSAVDLEPMGGGA